MTRRLGVRRTLNDVLTPEERRQRGRQGAYAQQAAHDTRETTRNARLAFNQRFLDQVDPDGTLPGAERARRALAARKAYFAGLALRSATARRRRSEQPVRDAEPL